MINEATGSDLQRDNVLDVVYQLVHRTASVCSLDVEQRAVVYHDFDPVERHREYYATQLQMLADRIAAHDRIQFFLYMTTLTKTREYSRLQSEWSNTNSAPDVPDEVRELLIAWNIADFSDPDIVQF